MQDEQQQQQQQQDGGEEEEEKMQRSFLGEERERELLLYLFTLSFARKLVCSALGHSLFQPRVACLFAQKFICLRSSIAAKRSN